MEIFWKILLKENMNTKNWWIGLSNDWKKAFNEVVFQKGMVTTAPIDAEIELLLQIKVLRFAGPTAAYPNMKTELSNLSGLSKLTNLETLVVINHHISGLKEIENLTNLKSLFIYENKLKSLEGVERMILLKDFYFNSNQISSLIPLQKLVNLETIYASKNLISSFDGIDEAHSYKLKNFHVLPNENLSDRDIIKFENTAFIKCLKG